MPYRGQFVDVIVGGAERGEANLLRELGKTGIGQQRHVAEQLVATVRLGRIKRVRRVANVLGAMEHAERQARQEVPGR